MQQHGKEISSADDTQTDTMRKAVKKPSLADIRLRMNMNFTHLETMVAPSKWLIDDVKVLTFFFCNIKAGLLDSFL